MTFYYYHPITLGNKELIPEIVSDPLSLLPLGRLWEASEASMPITSVHFYDDIGLYKEVHMASSYSGLTPIFYTQFLQPALYDDFIAGSLPTTIMPAPG
jgi:hypothetical protein